MDKENCEKLWKISEFQFWQGHFYNFEFLEGYFWSFPYFKLRHVHILGQYFPGFEDGFEDKIPTIMGGI